MERLEIIERLKHLPDVLAAEVVGLPETTLRYRPAEGEWSIKEVVGHICHSCEVWQRRLYMVWSMTDPVFISFDGEAWVRERGHQDAALGPLLAAAREQRLKMVDLLSYAVDWTRLGTQPGVGRRTLKQFAEFVLGHDADHLAQIRTLKAALAAATAP